MPTISEEEKLRRQESNADVLGTHAMEGIFPDAATSQLLERFASGELDRDQLSTEIDRHVQGILTARLQMAGAA